MRTLAVFRLGQHNALLTLRVAMYNHYHYGEHVKLSEIAALLVVVASKAAFRPSRTAKGALEKVRWMIRCLCTESCYDQPSKVGASDGNNIDVETEREEELGSGVGEAH